MQSAESGFLKGLGDKLRADPESLCNVTSQCVDLVKQGKAVYTNVRMMFNSFILFKETSSTTVQV